MIPTRRQLATQDTDPNAPLAWLPPTVAATALRLYALDAALLYDHDAPPARDLLAAYAYTQRPALPAPVAKELCAEPAADPAAAAAAVAASAPAPGGASGQAKGRVHTVLGPALAGEGRAIVNRLPPLPASLLVADAQPFSIDEARLQQTSPGQGNGAGRPPAGPSKPTGYAQKAHVLVVDCGVTTHLVQNAKQQACGAGITLLGAVACSVLCCRRRGRRIRARRHARAGQRQRVMVMMVTRSP